MLSCALFTSYNSTSIGVLMTVKTRGERLDELESFQMGVIAALGLLKAALQKSPGFNQTLLEDGIDFVLAQPPSQVIKEPFERPLRALRADQSSVARGTLHEE